MSDASEIISAMQREREGMLEHVPGTFVGVLDKGSVQLIDFLGDEDAAVDAARVSFHRRAANYTGAQNRKLLQYLHDHNHGTPCEMAVFKFRINAPVVVWWHFVRHRIASYNFVSGRYVPFDEKQVYRVAADKWRLQSASNKQGSSGEFLPVHGGGKDLSEAFDKHCAESFHLYDLALKLNVAREQARLFLPFAACYYEAIVLMNARSLANFLKLRTGGDAQSEIRDYAEAIRSIVSNTHPALFP